MNAAERLNRDHDGLRRQFRMLGEVEQQRLVSGDVVQHAGKELRVAGGIPNRGRTDAGRGEEATEPLAISGNEAKSLNRHVFCRFTAAECRGFSGQIFAFP